MEISITSPLSFIYTQPFLIAFLCCLLAAAIAAVRLSSTSPPSSGSRCRSKTASFSSGSVNCGGCNGVVLTADCVDCTAVVATNGVVFRADMPGVMAEKQTGASMMEQLVPEITTHALSYLDYPSLCRLSMTNSLMRKAANDDNAWKALYHKDFTLEQDSVRPVNGWKAYYAATRAIVNINAEFFDIIREKSLPAMSRFWLNADYVKCIHASGEFFTGYTAVMNSWQIALNWEQQADSFQVRDVRARVMTDMAWVTMKTYVNVDAGPFNMTNVFECHDGRWYMVHHHCSMLVGGDDQQVVHA